MKILQINTVCGEGSIGRIAINIHEDLVKHNHLSYIAYGRKNLSTCKSMIRIGNKFNEYLHAIHTRFFDAHGFASKYSTKKLIKRIIGIDPDVIHLHNLHGYYINIEVLFEYLKEAKKPIIWTLHDCWSFTGHCSHFDYIGCNKWMNQCEKCPQKNEYPKSILFDNSKYNYRKKKEIFTDVSDLTIITPSKWLAEIVSKSFLKDYPIRVINNGIDLIRFQNSKSEFRKKYNIIDKVIVLGVSNNWSVKKGLNAFLEISNNLDSSQYQVVLVGKLKDQSILNNSDIIHINHTNSIEGLADIYTSSNIFVNPTLEDTFPTVNIESLACGTPVLTFNNGGSPEIINKKCGFVLKNVEEMIETIKSISVNSFSKESCKNQADIFSKENMTTTYLDLYNNVIKNYDINE